VLSHDAQVDLGSGEEGQQDGAKACEEIDPVCDLETDEVAGGNPIPCRGDKATAIVAKGSTVRPQDRGEQKRRHRFGLRIARSLQ